MKSSGKPGVTGARLTVVHELMAMPSAPPPPMPSAMPPPPMMGMPMDNPSVRQAKTGMLLAGIGLILYSFLQFLSIVNIVSYILLIVGGVMAWMGASKAWPAAKMTVMAGFALILVGFIVWIVAWVLTPNVVFGASTPATVLNAFATSLLVGFVASLLTWIGVILLPWKMSTGSGRTLPLVGGILGILGSILVLALVYVAVAGIAAAVAAGGTFDVTAFLAALIGILIGGVLSLIGRILAGIGFIVGRNKMPAPTA